MNCEPRVRIAIAMLLMTSWMGAANRMGACVAGNDEISRESNSDTRPDRIVRIELTELLPAAAQLADAAVAEKWPEQRRQHAGKLFVDGLEVDAEALRILLATIEGTDRDDAATARQAAGLRMRLDVAANRPWSDVIEVIELWGECASSMWPITVSWEDAPARRGIGAAKLPLHIELMESLPNETQLADPRIAGQWTDSRRRTAGTILVAGSPVDAAGLRHHLTPRPIDEAKALNAVGGGPSNRLRIKVGTGRLWREVVDILEIAAKAGTRVADLEIVPTASDSGIPRPATKAAPKAAPPTPNRDAAATKAPPAQSEVEDPFRPGRRWRGRAGEYGQKSIELVKCDSAVVIFHVEGNAAGALFRVAGKRYEDKVVVDDIDRIKTPAGHSAVAIKKPRGWVRIHDDGTLSMQCWFEVNTKSTKGREQRFRFDHAEAK